MNKLKSFVRLDFSTVKPYFTVKTLLIYTALAIYMAVMSKSIASAIGVGMMLATLNVGYPFAAGEKCNMDALYVTLGADKRTVVKGRYIFALLLNLCAIVFTAVFSFVALAVTSALGNTGEIWVALGSTLALSAVFLIVQMFQIPMFFKLGYTKAKFMSILPFFLIMAVVAFFISSSQNSNLAGNLASLLESLERNIWFVGTIGAVIVAIIMFTSYELSLIFYKKREF